MTPSKKAGAPSAEQIRLPSAPVLDRYGLHAEKCECQRCNVGFAPTPADRDRARLNFERLERARLAEAQKQTKETKADVKGRLTWERLKASERETAERMKKMTAPVQRPATEEELDELKKLHGFKRRNAP